jgi:hypothetical protein
LGKGKSLQEKKTLVRTQEAKPWELEIKNK